MYLGGTKMGGTKRRWYEKTGNPFPSISKKSSMFLNLTAILEAAAVETMGVVLPTLERPKTNVKSI